MKFKYFKHDNLKNAEGIRAFGIDLVFKTESYEKPNKPSIDLTLWDRTVSLQFWTERSADGT